MPYKSRAEKKAAREKSVAENQAKTPLQRRRERNRQRREARQSRTQNTNQQPGQQGPWGPPLGGGTAPFDNDPNTMFSYYAPPQQFDFSQDMMPGNYNDPYNAYLAAIPVMQRQTAGAIGDALAQVGGAGNRMSSTAMNAATGIGAASAERQNQMLSELMYNQANQDLDRQMQAAMGYIQATPMVEEAMQSRLGFNYKMATEAQNALESARAARLARERMSYADFEKNKYGNLPFLTQFLTNNIGQGPEPIVSQTAGKEGYGDDIIRAFAAWWGGRK